MTKSTDDITPPPPEVAVPAEDLKALADGNNEFAIDLYKRVAATTDGNIVLSPFSIRTALAMAYAGAEGQTAEDMAKVLRFKLPPDRLHAALSGQKAGLLKLNGTDGNKLTVSNSLWVQRGLDLNPGYSDTLGRAYGASLRLADFKSNPEKTRLEINRWVEDETDHNIRDILTPGMIDVYTRFVLANAILFNGKWDKRFREGNTTDEKFYPTAGAAPLTVRMMNTTETFPYWEGDGVQILSLPYSGGGVHMVVVLPTAADGLVMMESSLTGIRLEEWVTKCEARSVQVSLPSYILGSDYKLKGYLSEMGMSSAFGMGADFGGICRATPLCITDVIHKAVVDVNERGTVAAAATVVIGGEPVSAPMPPRVFRADRPFLCYIVTKSNPAILFVGRVSDPSRQ